MLNVPISFFLIYRLCTYPGCRLALHHHRSGSTSGFVIRGLMDSWKCGGRHKFGAGIVLLIIGLRAYDYMGFFLWSSRSTIEKAALYDRFVLKSMVNFTILEFNMYTRA